MNLLLHFCSKRLKVVTAVLFIITSSSLQGFTKTKLVKNKLIPSLSTTQSKKEIISAKDTVYRITESFVAGKSTLRKVQEKAYNVSVIQGKDNSSTSDIGSLLDKMSGVRLRANGGLGSNINLSINGFQGKQIKIFLDGVPMENFGGAFQLNNIPMGLANRVEVYKGVVPVSLGADALGGAVNIVTNTYKKSNFNASYSYGSFNTHKSIINGTYISPKNFIFEGTFYQNYSNNNYKIQTDIADLYTGEYKYNQTVRKFHNKYHNETFIGKIGVINKRYADRLLFGIMLGQDYHELQNGARGIKVYGAWHQKRQIIMPSLVYIKKNLFTKGLDFRLNASFNLGKAFNIDTLHREYNWYGNYRDLEGKGGEQRYSLFEYRNNNGLVINNIDYKINNHNSLSFNNTLSMFDRRGFDKVYPKENKYDTPQKNIKNITGLSYKYNSGNYNISIFAKNYFQYSRHKAVFNLSSRWDEDSKEYKNKLNFLGYGLAFAKFLNPNLQVKTSFEKTYRLPENEELFGNISTLEGNPKLKPENSYNYNLGLTYWWYGENSHLVFNLNTFLRLAKDFIAPRLSDLQYMLVMDNIGKVMALGSDAELSYSYNNVFNASLSLTYQDMRDNTKFLPSGAKNITYMDRLPNIPYLYGNLNMSYKLPFLSGNKIRSYINYDGMYVHSFYLYWPSLGRRNSKFTTPVQIIHNVKLDFKYLTNWELALSCRNLLNSKAYDNFSLQKPGINFSIEIKYNFMLN